MWNPEEPADDPVPLGSTSKALRVQAVTPSTSGRSAPQSGEARGVGQTVPHCLCIEIEQEPQSLGTATVFIAVDHFTAECVGIHAAKRGTRFEALEPLRQGIREHFDGYREGIASGLALRHDHGSQFMSDHFQTELRFLDIRSSPAFVLEPQGNGCAERFIRTLFIRTLKEQLLWIERFDSVEALRQALLAFKDRYNGEWLIERHRHQTPAAVRAAFGADAAAWSDSATALGAESGRIDGKPLPSGPITEGGCPWDEGVWGE